MPDMEQTAPSSHWQALRLASGLSQREVERRLGWTKRGHLSLIERGIKPSPEQEAQLRAFYREVLL
jgi:transcriptional regulator with XRE-family HTH domain